MMYGLTRNKIREIITSSIERKPDLKYYIDNDYVYELVDTLIDGISDAIAKNTEEVINQITRELRGR